jgi:hypothetical protein
MSESTIFQNQHYKSKRFRNTYSHTIAASCEAIFPLLCPVRESEWLTDWKYTMIYSKSGIAELDAIFSTWYGMEQFWYVSRYVPCSTIEFIRIEEKRWIERLSITLSDAGNGITNVTWEQVTTTLSVGGEGVIAFWDEHFISIRESVAADLKKYFVEINSR